MKYNNFSELRTAREKRFEVGADWSAFDEGLYNDMTELNAATKKFFEMFNEKEVINREIGAIWPLFHATKLAAERAPLDHGTDVLATAVEEFKILDERYNDNLEKLREADDKLSLAFTNYKNIFHKLKEKYPQEKIK
jgi:hypothetical protein